MKFDPTTELISRNPEAWKIFSREEEIRPIFLDVHGRFPSEASVSSPHDPVVSEYLIENGVSYSYPDGKSFAVCLTHDIDSYYPRPLSDAIQFMSYLTKFQPQKGLNYIRKSAKSPASILKEMMSFEKSAQVSSTLFVLASEKFEEERSYSTEKIAQDLLSYQDNGSEIGLHGGLNSYISKTSMSSKKAILEKLIGKKVYGYRNHYLKFQYPLTFQLLDSADFAYDSTFAYTESLKYRAGMCHPYHPYDPTTTSVFNVVELPPIIMDVAMFHFLGLDQKTGWQIFEKMLDDVQKLHGVLTISWHNVEWYDPKLKFYMKMVDECKKRNAWISNGKEIVENFKKVR